jgi:hypothetical protein
VSLRELLQIELERDLQLSLRRNSLRIKWAIDG